MKNFHLLISMVPVVAGAISCVKTMGVKPKGANVAKSDTSTTLINNTELVGNWNIVTDSVSWSTDSVYQGTPADHYNFTKYGNLSLRMLLETKLL